MLKEYIETQLKKKIDELWREIKLNKDSQEKKSANWYETFKDINSKEIALIKKDIQNINEKLTHDFNNIKEENLGL